MKILFSIILLNFCLIGYSQRNYIYGQVVDSTTNENMVGVHVRNINAGLVTSSNAEGAFKIPAQIGDTLVLSSVGFKTLAWVADETWFQEESIKFLLPVNTIYLEEVVIGKYPEYERFKEELVKMDIEDTSFKVYGIPKVAIPKNSSLNASLAISGPFSAVHNAFSKRAKEKRKVQQLLRERGTRDKARLKFTREWVAESTDLRGDKLTSFIAYCNFTEEYLANTPKYIIHEDMMALLPDFLEDYKDRY